MAEFTPQITPNAGLQNKFSLCEIMTTLRENKRSILQNCAGFADLSANLGCAEDSLCGPLFLHHTWATPLEADKTVVH